MEPDIGLGVESDYEIGLEEESGGGSIEFRVVLMMMWRNSTQEMCLGSLFAV